MHCYVRSIICCLLWLVCTAVATGQTDDYDTAPVRGSLLIEQLNETALKYGVRLYYVASVVRKATAVRLPIDKATTVAEAFTLISAGSSLAVINVAPGEYAVVPDDQNTPAYIAEVVAAGRNAAPLSAAEAQAQDTTSAALDRTSATDDQSANSKPRHLVADEPLYRAFDRIGERYGVKILYHPDDVPFYSAFIPQGDMSLYEMFSMVTRGTNLLLVKFANDVYVVAPSRRQNREYADDVVDGWNSGRYRSPDNPVRPTLELGYGDPDQPRAADSATVIVRGSITDADALEPMFGAIVFNAARAAGTTTDLDGNFSIRMPVGTTLLEVRSLGYEVQPINLDVRTGRGAIPLSLKLYPQIVGFDEVVVTARSAGRAQREAAGGLTRISTRELALLPALTGDIDVLQALTTTAGVTATSEGSSGVSVRGGALDQNLVRQAGMTILYPAHALGFYPVFHPDMVGGVELCKGYVPPSLGGRASSVIDIDWRTGDMRNWKAQGAAGFFTSRLAVEGPIIKDKLSVLAGGRIGYVNYLLARVNNGDIKRSDIGFADVSAQATYRWKGGRLDVQGTYATDDFRFGFQFAFAYVNQSARVSLRQQLARNTYLRAEVSRSDYSAEREEIRASAAQSLLTTGVSTDHAGVSLRQNLANATDDGYSLALTVGGEVDRYNFAGRTQRALEQSSARGFAFTDPNVITPAVYGEAEYTGGEEQLTLRGGLRVSQSITTMLAGQTFSYEGPAGLEQVGETGFRESAETFMLPLAVQPRIEATYTPLGSGFTIGLSYAQLAQAIHQVSPTVSPTPLDIFLASSEYIPLTTANALGATIASGVERGDNSLGYEFGVYYRRTANINIGRQGSLLTSSSTPERGVYTADGYSLGAEASLRYDGPRTSLDVSYAYGRSFLDADLRYPELALQSDTRISAPTDLPHQVNINYAYQPSGRIALTAGFVFVSGRPFTPTDGLLPLDGASIPLFGQINSARLPPTHRLDIGFRMDNSESRRRGFRMGAGISFYNIYSRDNPYLAFYRFSEGGRLQAFQFAVIGEVIPALNVTFVWD